MVEFAMSLSCDTQFGSFVNIHFPFNTTLQKKRIKRLFVKACMIFLGCVWLVFVFLSLSYSLGGLRDPNA